MALDQFFNAKHEGCIVRAKAHARRNEGIKAVRWARVAETQRGNKTTIRSLKDRDRHGLRDPRQLYSIEQLDVRNSIKTLFHKNADVDIIKVLSLYGGEGLAPITVTQNPKNSSTLKIYFSAINPILNRNQTNKDQFQKLVEGFQDLIDVNTVFDMELMLSSMTWNIELQREKITVGDLVKITAVNVEVYINDILKEAGVPYRIAKTDSVYVIDTNYVKQLLALFSRYPSNFTEYALFRMLISVSMALPMKYRNVVEAYENALQSQSYSVSRDIQCAKITNELLPNHVGRLYVDKYFKDSTKQKVTKLVENIRQSMLQIFSSSDWMDGTTKDAAKKKAAAILDFIGYSTTITSKRLFPDVGNLTGIDFVRDLLAIRRITSAAQFNGLRYVFSRNSSSIPSAIVNAFYNPSKNSINFPAGILQKPFFDENYPSPLLYGVFGAVVGHEFTHGFDNHGSLFDEVGNQKNWWNSETKKKFNKRAEGLKKQYAEFNLCKNKKKCQYKIDGKRTLGENIADNGGLKAAFNAYKTSIKKTGEKQQMLPGLEYTDDQLFFAGFAHIWCRRTSHQSLLNQLKNEHSPARARVMVTLMNSYEFSEAFKCPPNSRMNPTKKYGVW
ncbi:neprilysin-1 [Octopus bimaculoides]|uniref:neprilysin-1 n=1 Tax=Octopus bimaculoides TaxID=37653 RepID=UPI00071C6986|nr:neprilysin-1 [Octopus bimaculoides]|eukprot:XP_014772527.1 PREDICTED: neprilysin-1-like [Octopus bimaculoides]